MVLVAYRKEKVRAELLSLRLYTQLSGVFTLLAVTTTPVSGAIYIDILLKGKKFWSGGVPPDTM